MDSMVNRYTSDRKIRSDDAYTPDAEPDKRPDRAVIVYAQRCREAFPGTPVVIGGIEASLRRIAHYDYWSDKVRRSVLLDAKADLLIFGNAERALVEIAHRLAAGETVGDIRDVRGTAFMVPPTGSRPRRRRESKAARTGSRSSRPSSTRPGASRGPRRSLRHDAGRGPTAQTPGGPTERRCASCRKAERLAAKQASRATHRDPPARLRAGQADPVLYAHASRVLHLESNPGNARAWCRPTASATSG